MELKPSQMGKALDRIAQQREGFTGLGQGYSYGIISRPENFQELSKEERREQTVWGITEWDEEKLGTPPSDEDIAAEAQKPEVPKRITPRQLRLALIESGVSISNIETALNAIEDETLRESALVEWEYALNFDRQHSLIGQIGAALGFSEEEIDGLFILGASK